LLLLKEHFFEAAKTDKPYLYQLIIKQMFNSFEQVLKAFVW